MGNISTFSDYFNQKPINEFAGSYEDGQDPIERLRNQLNPILGLIDLIKDGDMTLPEIEDMTKDIHPETVEKYLDDVAMSVNTASLSYLESKK